MAESPIKLFAKRSETYPEPTGADVAIGGVRAALSAIPIVGGSATEVMSLLVTPVVAQRRDDWFKDLADALEDLERKFEGFTFGNLVGNDIFYDAVFQATRIAVGTRHEDKRSMLRNGLLKIAVGQGPSEDKQQVYLNAVELFTPTHIRVLEFIWSGTQKLLEKGLWDPMNQYRYASVGDAIGALYPDLRSETDFLNVIFSDFRNRSFSNVSGPGAAYSGSPAITNLGIGFLQFILEPPTSK